jgi:hypothetical protein
MPSPRIHCSEGRIAYLRIRFSRLGSVVEVQRERVASYSGIGSPAGLCAWRKAKADDSREIDAWLADLRGPVNRHLPMPSQPPQ